MKKLICWVFGHKWEAKAWQTWYNFKSDIDFGAYDQCSRCGKVTNEKQRKISIKNIISWPRCRLSEVFRKID